MLDNVKKNNILKVIFETIKNKRKLNIIKYNKRLTIKLDITKQDFEIYVYLKEFNNKYNTNIKDIDKRELDLSNRYIENKGLRDLVKFKFNNLRVLNLDRNHISDINILEIVNFKELKVLSFGGNEISDINILEKVNFKELKQLGLNNNNISDIKVLEKVKFEKLELLSLGENNIDLEKNNLIISKLKSVLQKFII